MDESRRRPERNQGSSSCGGLECNICLDAVQDPVVTMCGHLYCWPCIYKWFMHSQTGQTNNNMFIISTTTGAAAAAACCPVCKSEILLETSLVPLYGRGQTRKLLSHDDAKQVPRRPPSPTTTCSARFEQYSHNHRSLPSFVGGGTSAAAASSSSTDLALADAVFARIFGNSGAHPNSYHHMTGTSSPSRLMMATDKSLTRVCSFLCCLILVCLVLF